MKGILNINGKFGHLLHKLGQIVLLSIYWIIFSIPVFTFGAASAALFYTARKLLRNEEGKIFDTYAHAFRQNFKQGVAAGLILLLVCAVAIYGGLLLLRIGFFSDTIGTVLGILYLLVMLAVLVYFHYVFAYVVTFEDSFQTVVRNCVYMALMHFGTSVRIAIQVVIVAVCLLFLNLIPYLPLILFLFPGVYTVLHVDPLDKVFRQYMPKEEQEAPEETAPSISG